MPSSTNGQSQYRLVLSGMIRKDLHRLQNLASLEGRGDGFLGALREIVDSLVHRPREFGEPLYQLSAMRLQVRFVAVRPLLVHFAVHEDYPLVFIKAVALLPD